MPLSQMVETGLKSPHYTQHPQSKSQHQQFPFSCSHRGLAHLPQGASSSLGGPVFAKMLLLSARCIIALSGPGDRGAEEMGGCNGPAINRLSNEGDACSRRAVLLAAAWLLWPGMARKKEPQKLCRIKPEWKTPKSKKGGIESGARVLLQRCRERVGLGAKYRKHHTAMCLFNYLKVLLMRCWAVGRAFPWVCLQNN